MYQSILLLAVVVVLVFLVFSIMRVAFKPTVTERALPTLPVNESMYDVPYKETMQPPPPPATVEPREEPAYVAPVKQEEQPRPIPEVAGQTEEELKAPEPLQERISQKVDTPSPKDPYDKRDNEALFGSNLRHPESMIASARSPQFSSLESEVASGVAGRPAVEQLPFSAEMAQNGGEFMNGIFAFDSSDSGTTFSSY